MPQNISAGPMAFGAPPMADVASFLGSAKKLNSDLGRHVKKCAFSNNLAGRFYQNDSMEAHMARKERAARMQAKSKDLERAIRLEDERIRLLEERLSEMERRQQDALELRARMEEAAVVIQSAARMVSATRRFELMQIERQIVQHVVLWCQAKFRGGRARREALNLRLRIIQHRKEQNASISIQKHARRYAAWRLLLRKRRRREIGERGKAAIIIQSKERLRQCRRKYHATQEEDRRRRACEAAALIQRMYRGFIGRRIAPERAKHEKAKERESAKAEDASRPKRIPLHLRRYSTYSVKGLEALRSGSGSWKSTGSRRSSCSDLARPMTGTSISSIKSTTQEETSDSDSNERIATKPTKEPDVCPVINDAPRRKSIDSSCSSAHEIESVHEEIHEEGMEEDDTQRAARIARKRAAVRVAQLGRRANKEKEKEEERKRAKAEKIARLDAQRREIMKNNNNQSGRRKKVADEAYVEALCCESQLIHSAQDNSDANGLPSGSRQAKSGAGAASSYEDVGSENTGDRGVEASAAPKLRNKVPLFVPDFEDEFSEQEDDLG